MAASLQKGGQDAPGPKVDPPRTARQRHEGAGVGRALQGVVPHRLTVPLRPVGLVQPVAPAGLQVHEVPVAVVRIVPAPSVIGDAAVVVVVGAGAPGLVLAVAVLLGAPLRAGPPQPSVQSVFVIFIGVFLSVGLVEEGGETQQNLVGGVAVARPVPWPEVSGRRGPGTPGLRGR